MNKKGSIIGLVLIIVGVAVTIVVATLSAKNDVDQMQKMNNTINTNQEHVQDMDKSIQDVNDSIQSGYNKLDEVTGY